MSFSFPSVSGRSWTGWQPEGSRLQLRAAPEQLDPRMWAALGGSLTLAKDMGEPWPQSLARRRGGSVLNMGLAQGGPETLLAEPALIGLARQARLRVIEIPDAINLSNPLYRVHWRRNDRFLDAAPALRRLYPEVDFTDHAFTRHMLLRLQQLGPSRFAQVTEVLRRVWVLRMRQLIDAVGGGMLLWVAGREVLPRDLMQGRPIDDDAPALVDAEMLAMLASRCGDPVNVQVAPRSIRQPDQFLHDIIADRLMTHLSDLK